MKEIPEIVYKYRSWDDENHKNILVKNEIFMPSAKDFNDPYDCRISQNFSLLSQEEKDQYIKDQTIKLFPQRVSEKINLVRKRIQNENFQKDHDKIEFEYFDNFYGVLSLSCRWNSVLMWSHYANKHNGFCIGFFEKKLRNSLSSMAVGYGRVAYQEDFPKLIPKVILNPNDIEIGRNRIAKALTKSVDWTYEEEYRILINFFNFFPRTPCITDRTRTLSDDVISEVIIGMKMKQSFRDEIISICNSKNIKVFQAKKDNFRFEINRELIK